MEEHPVNIKLATRTDCKEPVREEHEPDLPVSAAYRTCMVGMPGEAGGDRPWFCLSISEPSPVSSVCG